MPVAEARQLLEQGERVRERAHRLGGVAPDHEHAVDAGGVEAGDDVGQVRPAVDLPRRQGAA
ncbi:hypothetical protein [Geodermatophilus sp. SYSU D00766]